MKGNPGLLSIRTSSSYTSVNHFHCKHVSQAADGGTEVYAFVAGRALGFLM